MDKARLQELLDARVPAAPMTEDMYEFLTGQQELIAFLAEQLAKVSSMVMTQKTAIETIADAIFDNDDGRKLVGFDQPALIIDKVN